RLDLDGDEKIIQRSYGSDADQTWVRDKVCEEKLLSWSGELLSDVQTFYGDETQQHPLCTVGKGWEREGRSFLGNTGAGRWVTTRATTFNALGNKIAQYKDGITRSFRYDSNGVYVLEEAVAPTTSLTLRWQASWDNVIGAATEVTDPNGDVARMTYDALGRI